MVATAGLRLPRLRAPRYNDYVGAEEQNSACSFYQVEATLHRQRPNPRVIKSDRHVGISNKIATTKATAKPARSLEIATAPPP